MKTRDSSKILIITDMENEKKFQKEYHWVNSRKSDENNTFLNNFHEMTNPLIWQYFLVRLLLF